MNTVDFMGKSASKNFLLKFTVVLWNYRGKVASWSSLLMEKGGVKIWAKIRTFFETLLRRNALPEVFTKTQKWPQKCIFSRKNGQKSRKNASKSPFFVKLDFREIALLSLCYLHLLGNLFKLTNKKVPFGWGRGPLADPKMSLSRLALLQNVAH